MRILLLNDNPVVRKLVALSAQKTKDDLSIIGSVDEIEQNSYDLFIVDDALYSDDTMAELKEKTTFNVSLLMATRGNAVPAGFDHVINKPFLPTDLVELFAGIENNLSKIEVSLKESSDDMSAIDLDSMLDGLEHEEDFNTLNLDEDFDFDDIEKTLTPNILDHEEVQELQDLLDDTEDQKFMNDDLEMDKEVIKVSDLAEVSEEDDLLGSLDDFDMEEDTLGDLDDFESLVAEDEEISSYDDILDDEGFDDLELQIKKATGELGIEDLEQEVEDLSPDILDNNNLDTVGEMDMLDDLEGFEGINERDMKLALGEEVEDSEDVMELEDDLSFDIDEIEKPKPKNEPLCVVPEQKNSSADGVEALQTLLKALANDEVVKSLKGLNISININFGETK
jgi:uncharacterized membrane protein